MKNLTKEKFIIKPQKTVLISQGILIRITLPVDQPP